MFVPPLARDLPVAETAEPVDQCVDLGAQLGRRLAFRVRELALGHQDPRPGEVGSVELFRQLDQDVVTFDEDALEDLPDRFRDGRIDLELRGLEPPAPLAQVEELEHQRSSATSWWAAALAAFASR